MRNWMKPGLLVWLALVLIVFGIWGAIVWPGPFPSVLVPIGLMALLFAQAWQEARDKKGPPS